MHDGPQDGMIQLEGKNHRKCRSKPHACPGGTSPMAHTVSQRNTGPTSLPAKLLLTIISCGLKCVDYFLRSVRLGFRCWTDEDMPLAMELWGNPAVTALIGGPSDQRW